MADDIRRVGADPGVFVKSLHQYIFNVKFKFEDVNKLDELEEISKEDKNITTNRFKLLTKKNDFLIKKEDIDDESEGEERDLFAEAQDLEIEEGENLAKVKFKLKKGSYATVFIDSLFR